MFTITRHLIDSSRNQEIYRYRRNDRIRQTNKQQSIKQQTDEAYIY